MQKPAQLQLLQNKNLFGFRYTATKPTKSKCSINSHSRPEKLFSNSYHTQVSVLGVNTIAL